MTAVTNPLRTFQTPDELATYLNTDDKFKKETIISTKGPMCAQKLQYELDGLSEITALFKSAEENSQGFASNIEIKKLIHAYRIFLTNSSVTTDKLIAQSVKISNNCETIIDLVKNSNSSAAKALLGQTKELFQQSSRMFDSLIDDATALNANDTLLFTVGEYVENCGDLRTLENTLTNHNENGVELDPSFFAQKKKVEENIAALGLTVKKMGAISTRLLNSQKFWQQIKNDSEFITGLDTAEMLIGMPHYISMHEEEISSISSRWQELVRVTQLVSQSIAGVLASLKDPLPPESKQSQT